MAKRQPLSDFELFVAMAVHRLDDEAYGAAIRREIEARAERGVSIGAVYAALGRLEDKGLLRHRLSEPLPVKGGRSRKLFTLTPAGERALRESLAMLRRMMDGLQLRSDGVT
jgi:PadR family transcriptional regulator PadR